MVGRWWGRMIAMAGTGGCEGPATWKSKHDHSVTARFRMIDRLTKCAPRQQGGKRRRGRKRRRERAEKERRRSKSMSQS